MPVFEKHFVLTFNHSTMTIELINLFQLDQSEKNNLYWICCTKLYKIQRYTPYTTIYSKYSHLFYSSECVRGVKTSPISSKQRHVSKSVQRLHNNIIAVLQCHRFEWSRSFWSKKTRYLWNVLPIFKPFHGYNIGRHRFKYFGKRKFDYEWWQWGSSCERCSKLWLELESISTNAHFYSWILQWSWHFDELCPSLFGTRWFQFYSHQLAPRCKNNKLCQSTVTI